MIYVFLDTNIYIDNVGYYVEKNDKQDTLSTNTMVFRDLSGGTFTMLRKNAEKGLVRLIIPSVVKLEIEDKVRSICKKKEGIIEKLLHDLKTLTGTDSDAYRNIYDLKSRYSAEYAKKETLDKLTEFWNDMNCAFIKCEKIDVDALVSARYNNKPPFTKKKKQEYQDCFTMTALKDFMKSDQFNESQDVLAVVSNDSAFNEYASSEHLRTVNDSQLIRLILYNEKMSEIIREFNEKPELLGLAPWVAEQINNTEFFVTNDSDVLYYDDNYSEVSQLTIEAIDHLDNDVTLIWFSCNADITLENVAIPHYEYQDGEIVDEYTTYANVERTVSITGHIELPYICDKEGKLNKDAKLRDIMDHSIKSADGRRLYDIDLDDIDVTVIPYE